MHNRKFARGEVAEPGLRRTPGTRVDSKGFEFPVSATQSAIFALSAKKPKIMRMSAHFLIAKGIGDGHVGDRSGIIRVWKENAAK